MTNEQIIFAIYESVPNEDLVRFTRMCDLARQAEREVIRQAIKERKAFVESERIGEFDKETRYRLDECDQIDLIVCAMPLAV